ncbi:MAG: Fumarate hydratase class II, partial [uncultured Nocardioides sp.]
ERDTHRARLDGRGPGTPRRPLAGPDPARHRELPDQRADAAAPSRPGAGARQGRCGHGQQGARRPDGGAGRRDRGRCGRRRGRRARRRVPAGRLPDRLRDELQHERQRGARLPCGPRRRRGAPQRPRQRVAEQQRHLPDQHPRRGHPRRGGGPGAGARPAGVVVRDQGRGVRRHREVRPHPPHGRDAGDAGPGARGVCRHAEVRRRAARGRPAAGPGAAPRRHRGRHRDQHPGRVRDARHRGPRRPDGAALHRGARPLRGAGHARLPRRAVGCAPHDRGRAHQDLQRPALDVLGPDHGARRDPPPRPAARVEHHARQGQPRPAGGDAHGLRAGRRQRRDHRLGGRVGQLRAQRDDAGDGARAAGVHPRPVDLQRPARRALRRRHHRRRGADATLRRVLPLGRHPAQQVRRLRAGGQDRQEGPRRRRDHPRDGDRDGVRRAGRPHRGAARRCPRRGVDDPPL